VLHLRSHVIPHLAWRRAHETLQVRVMSVRWLQQGDSPKASLHRRLNDSSTPCVVKHVDVDADTSRSRVRGDSPFAVGAIPP
jgi:hypothetical protein